MTVQRILPGTLSAEAVASPGEPAARNGRRTRREYQRHRRRGPAEDPGLMHIWIDADACPGVIKDIPIRAVQAMRKLFLSYVRTDNDLADTPRFYDTVTADCTTLVYRMMRAIVPGLPLDYRILLSGYLSEYLYDQGGLDTNVPLQTLRERGFVGIPPILGEDSIGFSRLIRRHLRAGRVALLVQAPEAPLPSAYADGHEVAGHARREQAMQRDESLRIDI